MKTILLCATLAAGVLLAAPAHAASGYPGTWMPTGGPYPTYCPICFPFPQAVPAPVVRRPVAHHRGRARAVVEGPR
jgi:hypothetical protein